MIKEIEKRRANRYRGGTATRYTMMRGDIDWLLEDRERLFQGAVDLRDRVIDQAHERERLCKKCNDQEGEILRLKVELRRASL